MTRFESEEARRAWDAAAEAWEEFVESGADYYRWEVHGPGLLDACGDVDGLRALDLGCGQGWFSRQLAHKGARVTGVDLSKEMLRHARQHEEQAPGGIEYTEADAASICRIWPTNTFDLVTGCMSFHDMADPAAVIASSYRILTPNGRLLFSIPHPLTEMPYREWERDLDGEKLCLKVDRYFESGTTDMDWNLSRHASALETPRWRLTLSEWFSLITDGGFVVTSINEPRPTEEQVARLSELDDCRRLPYFLIFQCAKTDRVMG